MTQGGPRRERTHIYSVDDNSRQAELVAQREIVDSRRRDDHDSRGHRVSSGDKYYDYSKSSGRPADVSDDGYSYTDPASMYRDTEPVWRRHRAGSVGRSARPMSMTLDRGPRSSNRDLGPPPSTRGFDKINAGMLRDHHARSSSTERTRDAPKYNAYPDPGLGRSGSTRNRAPPAVHQEPREHRREPYDDGYSRREPESRRTGTADRFEDPHVASRGFGIAPAVASHVHQPIDPAPVPVPIDPPRSRPDGYGGQYYAPERAEARMPDPRVPDPRSSRDSFPAYEERPRERERDRRETDVDERGPISAAATAGAAAAATYGAAEVLKSRDRNRRDRERERDRDGDRDSDKERERERRREREERERRDERRDDRYERRDEDRAPAAAVAAIAAHTSAQDDSCRTRDRRYEDDEEYRRAKDIRYDEEDRERRRRRPPPSDESGDDRPRHYVDREAAREAERRRDSPPQEALDPDEEYRRRIQMEAERVARASRSNRDSRDSDSEKEKERRRRREDRAREREQDESARSRTSPPSNAGEPAQSRQDDRSIALLDKSLVQEPEPLSPDQEREKDKERRVTIVAPPKEAPAPPKGILRKPTEKFPEDPDPIREGVAPHKSMLKGRDIPPDARWTKIDRRLVNPEALEEAKERFEERMDCVIVLRVLTKSEIQKLADRTKEIREARGS